tara:strand:+ start:255 stop:596 length:342 start_codon:yes stop_codon:yes gene_type:complete
MNYFDSNDYESDSDDCYEPLDEDTLKDMILYSKLGSVSRFKKHIDKEPEFYGIGNLSDFTIFDIIETQGKSNKNYLSEYQIELFQDLYDCIQKEGNITNFNFVYEKLTRKIHV